METRLHRWHCSRENSKRMNNFTSTEQNHSIQRFLATESTNLQRLCYIHESNVENIVKRSAYVLVSALGIFANIFVIVLAIKCTVRKKLHHLIINMAVSDALFLFLRLLDGIPWLSNFEWTEFPSGKLGDVLFVTTRFLLIASFRVSLVTLLVISIKRFRATRQALQMPRPSTRKQRIVLVGVCWLIPMILATCELLLELSKRFRIYELIPFQYFYMSLRVLQVTMKGLSALFCCVIFVLSILTIKRLSRSDSIQNHLSEEQRCIRARRSRAAVQMVLVSVLLYFCCWTPIFFYIIFQDRTSSMSVGINDDYLPCPRKISMIIGFTFLPAVNAFLSPGIYIIFLTEFREATKNALCCCRKTRVDIASGPNNDRIAELQTMPNREIEQRRNSDANDAIDQNNRGVIGKSSSITTQL